MIPPHDLSTLRTILTQTPAHLAYCRPFQRGLLERIVKTLKGDRMEVGDKVAWLNHVGTVVYVVPANRTPYAWGNLPNIEKLLTGNSIRYSGRSRNHESYLVLVSDIGKKPQLHWPVVSRLRHLEEDDE